MRFLSSRASLNRWVFLESLFFALATLQRIEKGTGFLSVNYPFYSASVLVSWDLVIVHWFQVAGMTLDELQQFAQRLKDQGLAAGGVLHLAPPQGMAVRPGQALLPPDADDKGVGLRQGRRIAAQTDPLSWRVIVL
jgi:hypothetical protein